MSGLLRMIDTDPDLDKHGAGLGAGGCWRLPDKGNKK